MRCPKCGYISFDNVDECLRCKKKIRKASDAVKGTTYQAAAPAFLNFSDYSDDEENSDTVDLFADDPEDDSISLDDGDLEVLLTDNDEDDSTEEDIFELQGDADDYEEVEDDEDREIEIDFSKFEDQSKVDEDELSLEDSEDERIAELDIPEALADISDLAPPAPAFEKEPAIAIEPEEVSPKVAASEELDLESLDFDLGLDDEMPAESKKADSDDNLLSLDDLDFPEENPDSGEAAQKSKNLDMDDDLDFDLDLGGISIHKDL